MNKKIIYFVRHGESELNVGIEKIFTVDSKLTEEGSRQAILIADRASRLPIDVIVASTLSRAQKTAEYIGLKIGKSVEVTDLVVERILPSVLEGRSREDKEAQKIFQEWEESFTISGKKAGDGENFEEMKNRAIQTLSYLSSRDEGHILVVTHGFYLRMLAAVVMFGENIDGPTFGYFWDKVRTSNTGLFVFEYTHIWRMAVWNDHSHLG